MKAKQLIKRILTGRSEGAEFQIYPGLTVAQSLEYDALNKLPHSELTIDQLNELVYLILLQMHEIYLRLCIKCPLQMPLLTRDQFLMDSSEGYIQVKKMINHIMTTVPDIEL